MADDDQRGPTVRDSTEQVDDLTSPISAALLSRETDDRFTVHERVRRSAERRLARSGKGLVVARRNVEVEVPNR